MQTVALGQDAVIVVPFQDPAGNTVVPTALAYQVTDADGDFVIMPTAIADLTGTSTTITIPAATFEFTGGYELALSITSGGAIWSQEVLFGIVPAGPRLQFLINTFQSRAGAAFVARDMPGLAAWAAADSLTQEAALIEAYNRITRLNFWIPWPEILDLQNRIAPAWEAEINPRMWPLMTPTLFAVYPPNFITALNRAQVTEANAMLTVNKYAQRRAEGVFSEKIGESSIMFKNGIPKLQLEVDRDTLICLTGFINTRITTTRS